jgi:heme-degrading monooxygenase HmoA
VPYVRIALMQPKPGHADQVRELQTELLRFDRTLPGFLGGYLLDPSDGTGRIGRMILWETKADADHAAQDQHTLTMRSALAPLIIGGAGGHLEVAAEATRV